MSSLRLAVVSALLVSAAACSGGSSSQPTSPSPTPPPPPVSTPGGAVSSIVIPTGAEFLGNRAYSPPDLNVKTGTTVTWTNNDRDSHTTTSDAVGWNSGTISPGRQFSFTFQSAGAFQYHCSFHPGMTGTITVAD